MARGGGVNETLLVFADSRREESAAIRSSRWWTLAEIEATSENLFPEGLRAVVKQFVE